MGVGRHTVRPGRQQCIPELSLQPRLFGLRLHGRAERRRLDDSRRRLVAAATRARFHRNRARRRRPCRTHKDPGAAECGGCRCISGVGVARLVASRTARVVLGIHERRPQQPARLVRADDRGRGARNRVARLLHRRDRHACTSRCRRPQRRGRRLDEGDVVPVRRGARRARARARSPAHRNPHPAASHLGNGRLCRRDPRCVPVQHRALWQGDQPKLFRARAAHARSGRQHASLSSQRASSRCAGAGTSTCGPHS